MIDANKLSGFIERVEGDHRPVTADVFLTDFCNNHCGYCRFSHKTGKYIDAPTFANLLERLLSLGVKGIILTGGGEPTIDPDFPEICRTLEDRGVTYGVNTNGNVLHYIAPAFLKVSIDEGVPAKYKAARGVDALGRVLENVRKYTDWRDRNGIATRVGVQCVTTTPEQVMEFYEAIRKLDVNYIQFRPVEVQRDQRDYSAICDAVDALARKDYRITKSFKYGFATWRPERCYAHWASICVTPDLGVLYCCARPDEVVGNIFDDDILDKLAAYKPDMSKCETPCRLTGANAYVMQYRNDGDRYFV